MLIDIDLQMHVLEIIRTFAFKDGNTWNAIKSCLGSVQLRQVYDCLDPSQLRPYCQYWVLS
jgi:hypothetical protein